MDGISIIVCCYNSGSRLLPTLTHLARQKCHLPFEVIVVDNASNDDTFLQVQIFRKLFNISIPFKILMEPKQGLSYARNKGIEEALYEYIVFCDDDNWLEENYILNAYDFLSKNPTYAATGGKSEAVFQDGIIPPTWFKEIESAYAIGQQGPDGNITSRGYLWGAGISFRKSIYLQVFNKDYPSLLTGRKGTELSSGEDTEFCMRCILIGYELNCSSELKFKHFISSTRLTNDYKNRLFKGFESATEVINKYNFFLILTKTKGLFFLKIRLFFKSILSLFKLRKLTKNEINVINILLPIMISMKDKDYQMIHKFSNSFKR